MTVPTTTLASSDVRRGMKDDQGIKGDCHNMRLKAPQLFV